jgi:hypothetical protein
MDLSLAFLLALSLFGFLPRHHPSLSSLGYDVNLVKPSQVQGNDEDSWYIPPRSPAFNDLFGS